MSGVGSDCYVWKTKLLEVRVSEERRPGRRKAKGIHYLSRKEMMVKAGLVVLVVMY